MARGGLPQDLPAVQSEGAVSLRVIKSDPTTLVLKRVVHSGPLPPIYTLRVGPDNTIWRVPLDPDVTRAIRTPIKVFIDLHY